MAIFYGVTSAGGGGLHGTAFKITPSGTFTTIHTFCDSEDDGNCIDLGAGASLVIGSDGNLYGTTSLGGTNTAGLVFKLTLAGELTELSFCSLGGSECLDGSEPDAGVVQGSDGSLYGTTSLGGTLLRERAPSSDLLRLADWGHLSS